MVFLGFHIVSFPLLQMRPLSFNVLALPFSIILFIKHFDSEHHCLVISNVTVSPLCMAPSEEDVGNMSFYRHCTIAIRV